MAQQIYEGGDDFSPSSFHSAFRSSSSFVNSFDNSNHSVHNNYIQNVHKESSLPFSFTSCSSSISSSSRSNFACSFSRALCGDTKGDELWNVWDSRTQNFTPCFEDTIVQFVPFIYIFIIGSVYYFRHLRLRAGETPKSHLFVDRIRLLLSSLLALLPLIIEIVNTHFFHSYRQTSRHQVISILLISSTFCIYMLIQRQEVLKGSGESRCLRLFWCLVIITKSLKFLSFLKSLHSFPLNVYEIFLFFGNFVDLAALFVAASFYLFVEPTRIPLSERMEQLHDVLLVSEEEEEEKKEKTGETEYTAESGFPSSSSSSSSSAYSTSSSSYVPPYSISSDHTRVLVASPLPLVSSVAPPHLPHPHPAPELNANFLSYITFGWVSPIISKGKNGCLEQSDLFDLHPQEKADVLAYKVSRLWEEEMIGGAIEGRERRDIRETRLIDYTRNDEEDESRRRMSVYSGNVNNLYNRNTQNKSLIRVFRRAFGKTFFVAGILKLSYDILLFSGPVLIKKIINFLKLPPKEATLWGGMKYVLLLFTLNVLQSVILHQYFHRQFRLGMRLRSAATSLIYKKSLRIFPGIKVPQKDSNGNDANNSSSNSNSNTSNNNNSNSNTPNNRNSNINSNILSNNNANSNNVSANNNTNSSNNNTSSNTASQNQRGGSEATSNLADTTGGIINLMSVDCQRLQDLMVYIHIVWSAPLQITIALFLLYINIGVSAFAGILVAFISVGFTGLIANRVKFFQNKVMKVKDERIKICNEVLNGIKIIKLYAWEESFFKKITSIRTHELDTLWKYQLTIVSSRVLWTAVPVLVAIFTFLTFNLLGNEMDAAVVFTALALFNILRFPLQLLPYTINNIMEAYVSINRLQSYLEAPELPHFHTFPSPLSPLEPNKEDRENGEKQKNKENQSYKKPVTVSFQNVDLAWPNGTVVFNNISFTCRAGEMTIIAGRTGSGKTALLSSMIGDIPPNNNMEGGGGVASEAGEYAGGGVGEVLSREGKIEIYGDIAYAAQIAWIQNCSLKDNICFGEEYDEEWYTTVVKSCALDKDIDTLPNKHLTIIGEKGITLSGGQKQRVALARALYKRNKNVYLLDDILSAVDSHVATHIINNCILNLLRNKTVIIVTHKLDLFPLADQILFVDNKTVLFQGNYTDLKALPEFVSFAAATAKEKEVLEEEEKRSEGRDLNHTGNDYLGERGENGEDRKTDEVSTAETERNSQLDSDSATERPPSEKIRLFKGESTAKIEKMRLVQKATQGAFVDTEFLHQGKVSAKVYWSYLQGAGGLSMVSIIVLVLSLFQISQISSNSFLSYWSDNAMTLSTNFALRVYSSINILQILLSLFCYLSVAVAAQKAARVFHGMLLTGILRAPMLFFETTPVGRILNRFSKDTYVIDEQLPASLMMYVNMLFQVFGTFILISYVLPAFILLLVPITAFYCYVQNYYIPSSRQLQRIESALKSPIFSHFGETLDGCSTIRAFNEQGRFIRLNEKKVNENLRAYYVSVSANRWLALRLEFVGTCVVSATSFLSVLGMGYLTPGLAGLAIAYALNISQTLNWLVRMASDRESNIIAVERVNEYGSEIPQEDTISSGNRPLPLPPAILPSSTWPDRGKIVFKNFYLRYRPELPYVLKNINITILPKERIGIVGRTGAGKSSILISLMRLVEHTEGQIIIDDVDIRPLPITHLRSVFSIIPQDPVLFSGTIRSNIDPFNNYTDQEVWRALDRARLKNFVLSLKSKQNRVNEIKRENNSDGNNCANENEMQNVENIGRNAAEEGGMEEDEEEERHRSEAICYEVEEGGRNFSMGQKQLICLARALIRESRILLLDEATSVVDPSTDKVIQNVIRTQFVNSTILTIAHRLNTVLDYDKILFMADGMVREFDSPTNLLKKEDSQFRQMVMEASKGHLKEFS